MKVYEKNLNEKNVQYMEMFSKGGFTIAIVNTTAKQGWFVMHAYLIVTILYRMHDESHILF